MRKKKELKNVSSEKIYFDEPFIRGLEHHGIPIDLKTRKRIAALNGIPNYDGRSTQNETLSEIASKFGLIIE